MGAISVLDFVLTKISKAIEKALEAHTLSFLDHFNRLLFTFEAKTHIPKREINAIQL